MMECTCIDIPARVVEVVIVVYLIAAAMWYAMKSE